MWEGLGGPVHVGRPDFTKIDPTLEDCCRQEEEMQQVRRVVETSLRRHDVVAMADRRRRHLVRNVSFEGCRCGYDPDRDGGEYRAFIDYRQQKQQQQELEDHDNEQDENNKDHYPTANYNDRDDQREENVKYNDNNEDNDSNNKKKDDNDDEDDDEFDYLLDEDLPDTAADLKDLEDRRRAELEWIILHHETAKHHGYGVHRQLNPTRVLKAAGLTNHHRSMIVPPPPAAVVVHLVDPDSWASASLDDYLEQTLAPQARGTMFLRSGGRSTLLLDAETIAKLDGSGGGALQRLNPDHDMPALVAIRDGAIVNVCPKLQGLTQINSIHNEPVIVPEAVYEWLDRSGVLLPQPPPMELLCAIRPEEEALLDNMRAYSQQHQQQQRGAEPSPATFFRCGVPGCQKTYPHEHVGVQTAEQDGHVVSEEDVLGSTSLTAQK